jgi:hypothetical protein
MKGGRTASEQPCGPANVICRESQVLMTQEEIRLSESDARKKHWKRWGPYLSERAWGTVREDYSPYGAAWEYLPHDHSRSRAYRWNEDGIAGISDRRQSLCFAFFGMRRLAV